MAAKLGDLATEAFRFDVFGMHGGSREARFWMDKQQSKRLISGVIFAFPGNSSRNEPGRSRADTVPAR
jgi:hypothetical protein